MADISIEGPFYEKAADCVVILRRLPDWFGIEAAIRDYEVEIDRLPTFVASLSGHVTGFLSVKQHNSYSAEIYVMGIEPGYHRQGIGRALVRKCEGWLKTQGCEYLQVKTLGPANNDPNYAKTRLFYEQMGFRPLEEFKQLWDENNPCLIMVKPSFKFGLLAYSHKILSIHSCSLQEEML